MGMALPLKRFFSFSLLCIFFWSCGSNSDGGGAATHIPFIDRLDPASGVSGDSVRVIGSGFSEEEDNVVFVCGEAVVETDWDITADTEEEFVSFTLPDSLAAGDCDLFVMVGDEVSNTVTFSVSSP